MWLDADAPAGVTLYYKLEDVDVNGKRTLPDPVSTNAIPTPTAIDLVSLVARGNRSHVVIMLLVVICAGMSLLRLLARRQHYQTVRCVNSKER